MKRSPALLLGIATFAVVLDQWTKRLATEHLASAPPVRLVGELVQLTYTRNSGIAFGLLAGRNFPLYVFSIIAAVAVIVLFLRHARLSAARHVSLALILGGAVGNLIDRVTSGEVVDFILLAWRGHEFPVFNLADVAVTTGVALFALVWSRDHDHDPAVEHPEDRPAGGAETDWHESHDRPDRASGDGGRESGPLAREGADRTQP
ncbi:MAG: signal peptidase II [Candidatus Eisenbacteria bacterium]|nr:signal peptidase II [Candidatus Eisenbacteria bacterium]